MLHLRISSWIEDATNAEPVSTKTRPSSVLKADTLANDGYECHPVHHLDKISPIADWMYGGRERLAVPEPVG